MIDCVAGKESSQSRSEHKPAGDAVFDKPSPHSH